MNPLNHASFSPSQLPAPAGSRKAALWGSILLILLTTSLVSSAQTHITIHMPGSQNRHALLWTYADLISYREVIQAESTADKKGNIEFVLHNKEVVPVKVQVDFFVLNFYVQANSRYELQTVDIDFSRRDFYPKNIIAYLEPQYHILKPTFDVNAQIDSVNSLFGRFLDAHYINIYQSSLPGAVLDSFLTRTQTLRKKLPSPFARQHLDIQTAQLQLATRRIGQRTLINQWFSSGKIQYHNKVYMDFFNSYWSKYLLTGIKGMRYGQLDSVINRGRSYSDLSRLLEKKDVYLRDPVLRELVILRNLMEIYNSRLIDKDAVRDILYDITAKGANEQNKTIARHVLKELMEYDDHRAPDFMLPGFDGRRYSLKSFEGKYLYLNFWTEECRSCLAQMDYEKELYLDFDDVIDFVSVYVGPDSTLARKIFKQRGYQWTGLYFNDDFTFLKNYKAEMLPYYVFIDKEGKLLWFPAHKPSEAFSDYFIQMLNDKKGNLKQE